MYKFITDMKKPEKLARMKALKYKTHHLWLKVVDVIKRRQLALRCIYEIQTIRDTESNWVSTDDIGSGFDKRYTDISWIDTR